VTVLETGGPSLRRGGLSTGVRDETVEQHRESDAQAVGLGILVGAEEVLRRSQMGQAAGRENLTGTTFIRPDAPWWVYAAVAAAAAVVALITSALPARRASVVPVLEAAKAE
jgi:ABC-type lipoprotein release transport system permease subunit